jgi:methylphosphotriester-DNA--protein-cysteine methyltransferase
MKSDQEFVDKLIGVVKRNYTNANFDIVSMAAEMSISDRQLQRKVKALTGQSPVEFLRQFRLEESLRHLREGVPVGEAATRISRHVSGPDTASLQSACKQRKVVATEREIGGFLITDKPYTDTNCALGHVYDRVDTKERQK